MYMHLSALIRACTEKRSIFIVTASHANLIVSGCDRNLHSRNLFLTLYAKLGHFDYAQKVFDEMRERNAVAWTILISGYHHMGCSETALNCFKSMVLEDQATPNAHTYVAALSACAETGSLRNGEEIHGRIFRTGGYFNSYVSNSLINLYGKCGLSRSARRVFDSMPELNSVSCVSLMSSYIECGDHHQALLIFLKLYRMGGIELNAFAYCRFLDACTALGSVDIGTQSQCFAVKSGMRMDRFSTTSLVNLYAKCGDLESAERALQEADDEPNVAAWTALIGGCTRNGNCREAVRLFKQMLRRKGLKPNEQTFSSVLGALGREGDTKRSAMQLHCWIAKSGFGSFTFVSNALLDLYARFGCLNASVKIFDGMMMHRLDVVSWNSLIAGFVSRDCYVDAVESIKSMISRGFSPNIYTYTSLLKICSTLPSSRWGKQTHCRVLKPGFDSDVAVGSSLVDMYAKCGRLSEARKVFESLPSKNLVSWNSMIAGYAQHGLGTEGLEMFETMVRNEVKPDHVTFIGVLSSCAHAGDLEKSLHHFGSMSKEYGIDPNTDHVACVVRVFARKGRSRDALDFVAEYCREPSKIVWRSLLSGCVEKGDLEMAKYAAEQMAKIDPHDTSALVMLSNAYADSKMWDEASQVRRVTRKETGYSKTNSN